MARVRTFIAVDVPDSVRRAAKSTVAVLSAATQSIRWVPPQNVHITMKFLGDVDETDIYQVCRLTAEAVRDCESIQVICRGIGAFPKLERPRTVWLGIEDRDDQLGDLHQRVEEGLSALGFPRDQRRYHPHVTLGRLRYGRRDVGDLVARMSELEVDAGPMDVEELVIYASELSSEGPAYTVLGRAPLAVS